MSIQPLKIFTENIVETEWDAVAESRDLVIQNGDDISLIEVTEPFIMESIRSNSILKVLDCGCGTGHLSSLIAEVLHKEVDAIDISGKSIQIAKSNYANSSMVHFEKMSIQQKQQLGQKYDACIANMVLMDMPNLKENLDSIYHILQPNGIFCFTITHPCFWPLYSGYFFEPWFHYEEEIVIQAPFTVNNRYIGHTSHVHRPLTKYISMCKTCGFELIEQKELYPHTQKKESNYKYTYPRFLGFVCKKTV